MLNCLIRSTVAAAGLVAFTGAAHATILTFDVAGGVSNFQVIDQGYGDNVAASPDGAGHSYGVGAEGFTPNTVVSYGSAGEDPSLWTTGYGDLTNSHFNDLDNDTTFTVRFTADPGYAVTLYDFDIASFLTNGQTIVGLQVRDGGHNSVLYSQSQTFIIGATHLQIAPNATANDLILEIDLTGLGGVSDDIGIDNVRFGERQLPPPEVPVPAALPLLAAGVGVMGLMGWRRKTA